MKRVKKEIPNSPRAKEPQAGEITGIKGVFRSNAWIWIPAFLVAAVTFAVFLPSIGYEFINYDDDRFVYDNPNIVSMGPDFFQWAFTNRQYQWSPLRWISHALDYKIWQLNPLGHHLSNIIIHSLNAFLVVILAARLCEIRKRRTYPSIAEEEDRRFQRKALIAGAVTGLLFSIHPLRVESVAWVAERKDVLFAFFFLLSVISYLRYCSSPDDRQKKRLYYVLALVLFIMSVMSKAAAVTLPLVLVLLDFYPLERVGFRSGFDAWRRVLVEKLPFFAIGGAVALINIGIHESMGVIIPMEKISFTLRALLAIKTFAFYLIKMVWPFDLTLIYGEPYKVSLSMPESFGLIFFLATATALCVFLWHNGKRIWLAVWIYYIVMLLPVSVIKVFSTSFAHDRYTYMPSIGPFLLAGIGAAFLIDKMKGKSRAIPVLMLVTVLSFFAGLTIKQSAVWKNSITLWNSVLEHTPSFVSGYFSRGTAYIMAGKYSEALKDLNHVIDSLPMPYLESYNMRGVAYKETGDFEAALRDFSKVIELEPGYAAAYNNRADVYTRTGNYQMAKKDLETALRLDPHYSITRINLCSLNNAMGNFHQAIKECSATVEMSPGSSLAYKRRGFAYNALGKYKEAIYDYDKAVSLSSRDYETYHLRGIAYKNAGRHSMAVDDFSRAIDLNSKFADAYVIRGVTYGQLGKLEDAVRDFTAAIGMKPNDASAYYNRGAALYQLGREKEAMKDFRKAAGLGDKTVQKILRERGISY